MISRSSSITLRNIEPENLRILILTKQDKRPNELSIESRRSGGKVSEQLRDSRRGRLLLSTSNNSSLDRPWLETHRYLHTACTATTPCSFSIRSNRAEIENSLECFSQNC